MTKEERTLKRKKWTNILIWVGLAVLIGVVIATSIVLHAKKNKLEELKDKNQAVSNIKNEMINKNKIFFKNFEIFIDNQMFF